MCVMTCVGCVLYMCSIVLCYGVFICSTCEVCNLLWFVLCLCALCIHSILYALSLVCIQVCYHISIVCMYIVYVVCMC